MKTSVRNLIVAGIAGISIVSASAALAGGPGCGGFGPGMMGHGPGWGGPHRAAFAPEEMAAYRLDVLKQSLKLQGEQQKAWDAFAAAVEAQAKRMGELRDEMWGTARPMPERIDQASSLAKERERGLEEIGKVVKALYEVLTPEQRKALDRRGPWFHG